MAVMGVELISARSVLASTVIFLLVCLLDQAMAQESNGRRVALLIGNSQYEVAESLANPTRDVRLIARTLRGLGFTDVADLYDLTLPQMNAALSAFTRKADGAEIAFIYYASRD